MSTTLPKDDDFVFVIHAHYCADDVGVDPADLDCFKTSYKDVKRYISLKETAVMKGESELSDDDWEELDDIGYDINRSHIRPEWYIKITSYQGSEGIFKVSDPMRFVKNEE